MRSILIGVMVVLSGCTASQDYYRAVEEAAKAQERVYSVRYQELAKVAAAGGEAGVAATMAMALSQPQTIQPQYIESAALKWAQVLVPSATALGGMYMQGEFARDAAKFNRDVQIASINADQAIALGQQDMIIGLNAEAMGSAVTTAQAFSDIAIAGFGALNTSAMAGFTAADNATRAGIAGMVSITGQHLTATEAEISDIIQGFRDVLMNLPEPIIVPPPDPIIVPPADPIIVPGG